MYSVDEQSTKNTFCDINTLIHHHLIHKSPIDDGNNNPQPLLLTNDSLAFDMPTSPPHLGNSHQDVGDCGQQASRHVDAVRNAQRYTVFNNLHGTIAQSGPMEEMLPRVGGDNSGHGLLHKLPGFRFHPTEHELVGFYLRRKVEGTLPASSLIPDVDFYNCHPWELCEGTEKSLQREWFFFVLRDSKYPHGGRPNRRTKCGFWKATGTDKIVKANFKDDTNASIVSCHCYGLRKTLVYYKGRAPRGSRTHWIMHEYCLSYNVDPSSTPKNGLQSSITLCKVYKKNIPHNLNKMMDIDSSNVKAHIDETDVDFGYILNTNFESYSCSQDIQIELIKDEGRPCQRSPRERPCEFWE